MKIIQIGKKIYFLIFILLPQIIFADKYLVDKETYKQAVIDNSNTPSITLNTRQLCDLELILNKGFAPLEGFLVKEDYESVLHNLRLKNYNNTLWPIPITLDCSKEFIKNIGEKNKVALRDEEGFLLATISVSSIWNPNKSLEALQVYGTLDQKHPGVYYLFNKTKDFYLGGKVKGLMLPRHYDNQEYRHTPESLKRILKQHKNIVGFQTRNPLHRAHKEITCRASESIKGHLLINPVVGETMPGDIDYFTRVKCYKKILKYYPEKSVTLSLLPLSMRMAGPREALWHAIIRKNYGCTHFIIGRDHAGPGLSSKNKNFYGPYEAQELVEKYSSELGIKIIPFKMMVYVPKIKQYLPIDQIKEEQYLTISGTELRKALKDNTEIPDWFSYPEIVSELRKQYKYNKGLTVFFTGLSGAGKSTLAKALQAKISELTNRQASLLDGDLIRQNLSSELGFSKFHRDLNVKRIGFVASEITKTGGIAICAPIAPYQNIRDLNKNLISKHGTYVEIYVSTPLQTCENRDTKGLYKKARLGIIKNFTGISDPYEIPKNPSLIINTENSSIENCLEKIINYLTQNNFI